MKCKHFPQAFKGILIKLTKEQNACNLANYVENYREIFQNFNGRRVIEKPFSPQGDGQLVLLPYLLHQAQLSRSRWRRRHLFCLIPDNLLRSCSKNATVSLNFPTMQRRKSRRSTVWMRTRAFR